MTVLVGSFLQGGSPLTALNPPVVPCIFMGPPPTLDGISSQAHQSVMISLKKVYIGNKAGVENGEGAARLAAVASAVPETTLAGYI